MAWCVLSHVGYHRSFPPCRFSRCFLLGTASHPSSDSVRCSMAASLPPAIFQLRIRLCTISPLIWRRLLVRSDTTLATLHPVIQTVFGWPEANAYCFVMHGTTFGSATDPARTAPAAPPHLPLATFCLRPNERFTYTYRGADWWRHEIRLEQILDRKSVV